MRNTLIQFLKSQEGHMLQLLEALVLQPSSSRCKTGVNAVARLVSNSLSSSGMNLEIARQSEVGDHLIFRSPACKAGKPAILLFGHMDTVFPQDSPFNWYKEHEGRVYGPGVIDMKGGLVCAIYALKALAHCKLLETLPIIFICNSDEEIGSPSSSALFAREARNSALALGFECGGPHGEVATGRKGRLGYTMTVSGKAGHAAFAGADKASAILELAHKIIALEALNDQTRQIIVNVGTIIGGIGPNTVAEKAAAEIDTRFLSGSAAKEIVEKIAGIARQCSVPGTTSELTKTGERLPMEQTPANNHLFQIVSREANNLSLPCIAELRSGVSDANTIAQAGIPVLDGMGPMGDCDHSDREYMLRDSLLGRSTLAACTLVACWEQFRL